MNTVISAQAKPTTKRQSIEQAIYLESVRIVHKRLAAIILGSVTAMVYLLAWISIVAFSWNSVYWIFGLIALNIPLIIARYRFDLSEDDEVIAFARFFITTRFMIGAVWVYGVISLMGISDPPLLWVLAGVFGALSAGVVATQAALPWAVVGYIVPPTIAIAGYYATADGHSERLVLLAILLFGLFIYKQAAEIYRETRESLKIRIMAQQNAAILAEQTVELNRLMQMKDLFLATVSHDLRQPAQTILLVVESLQAQQERASDSTELATLKRATDQINGVITRLLDVARLDLEKGKPDPDWFDLNVLLGNVSAMMAISAERKSVQININIDTKQRISVYADAQYVERIIQNLLVNAIEHSGGTSISIETEITSDDELCLVLTDNGKGLSNEVLQSFSVPSPSSANRIIYASTADNRGLGLSIARRLASVGRYPLRADSPPGGGARFELILQKLRTEDAPISKTTAIKTQSIQDMPENRTANPAQQHKESVLIVEDDALVRLSLFAMFKQSNYEPVVSEGLESAKAALQKLSREPTIILIDWHLRDGETAESVLPRLFEQLTQKVPVLVLSGEPALANRVREVGTALGNAPIGFLQKPASAAALFKAIDDLRRASTL